MRKRDFDWGRGLLKNSHPLSIPPSPSYSESSVHSVFQSTIYTPQVIANPENAVYSLQLSKITAKMHGFGRKVCNLVYSLYPPWL